MGTKATKFVEQTTIEAQRLAIPDPEFYKLIDSKGGGELVKLTREAMRSKDFSVVDKAIKEKVVKFLYNDGRGDYINVEDLVKARMVSKPNLLKKVLQEGEDQPKSAKSNIRYTKYVCFDIEKRGKFGETILHTCLRNCETVHNELAKRIIKIFPQMINDFSLSEEFYGETPLHAAIANQNPEIVRILLSKRANVHARCIGTMFGPRDQKFNRKDILGSEFPILSGNTSFEGFAYFGEYPLNFAACLNQEECVRLLLAKGANPNKQDMFGNTTLHMMVLHDNIKLFQLIWANGVEMNIKNKQGYTPLVLATKMNRPHIYEHIMEDIRDLNWTYADVSCASYPLYNLDSISPDGKTDFESVLMTLVNSSEEEHLEMFEGVILEMINQKWELYCKFKFYCQFALFIVYMAVCGATILMKRAYFFHLDDEGCVYATAEGRELIEECKCAYLYPNDSNRYLRMTFEILTILLTIFYAAIFISELLAQKLSVTIKHLYKNPFKAVFICGIICTLVIIPMRFTCNHYGEDILVCLAIVIMPFYILYLARGFRRTSMFVFTIHKGISWNFYVWACISMIFYMGFSQGLYVASGYGEGQTVFFVNPITAIINCLSFSDHDFSKGYLAIKASPYPVVAKIIFFFSAVFCNIIMTNMLIASFLELYAEIVKSKLEWIRQWAMNVIAIELTMKPSERLQQQKKYVQYMDDGQKSIILRWKEKNEELKESRKNNFEIVREQLFTVPDSGCYKKS